MKKLEIGVTKTKVCKDHKISMMSLNKLIKSIENEKNLTIQKIQ